jgi:hypothetical protein
MQSISTCGTEVADTLAVRESQVAERIREKSGTFSIRQSANINRMSIPYLRIFADRHGITFAGDEGPKTKRLASSIIARERNHTSTIVARSLSRKPVTSLDSDKITPALRERARRREQEESNSFIEKLRELTFTHNREQAAKQMGISPTFMRTLAYDQVFVSEATAASTAGTSAALKKLQSTLFRIQKKSKPSTMRLIRDFMLCDAKDVL